MRKIMYFLITLSSLFYYSELQARWSGKHLDPFNKNSGVRNAARKIDPTMHLNKLKNNIVNHIGMKVASDDGFRSKAEESGWNLNTCRVAGASIASLIAGFQGAAICVSMVAGEPLSAAGCTMLIVSSGSAITAIACTQLCNDKKLRDCQ